MENFITAYFYIATISTAFFVIKLIIFSVFGGDMEVQADFDVSTETDTSFDFLSIQSILAFLMGFGWLGLACLQEWHFGIKLTILLSVIFGLIIMYFSAWLMFCIKKLNHKVVKDLSKAVGTSARTYTSFHPHSKGQIEVTINDQLSIEEAFNDTDEEIKSFINVKIVKYENELFYIEKE